MDIVHFFISLVIILLSAKLMGELFAWMKLPSVLGEVAAGVIVGPSLLGWVHIDSVLLVLAEIGILLLLFEVGLETDVAQLIKVGPRSVLVAVTGIAAPALLAYGISIWILGLPFMVTMFICGTLVATSIGISLRVLREIGQHETPLARTVLGAAVLDDIAGVLILAVLFDFAVNQEVNVGHTAAVFGYIVAFLLVAPVMAKLLVPAMSRLNNVSRTEGMIPTLAVALMLAFAVIAHMLSAPAILGAFAAGIALSRHFFIPVGPILQKQESFAVLVEHQLKPISGLFVPIFFFVVGASVNLRVIDFSSAAFWWMAGLLTVAAVLGKVASGMWAEGTFQEKLLCGMAMVPRGEVGLIFAEVGKKNGVLDETLYAVTVFVVVLTTFIAPVVLRRMVKGS